MFKLSDLSLKQVRLHNRTRGFWLTYFSDLAIERKICGSHAVGIQLTTCRTFFRGLATLSPSFLDRHMTLIRGQKGADPAAALEHHDCGHREVLGGRRGSGHRRLGAVCEFTGGSGAVRGRRQAGNRRRDSSLAGFGVSMVGRPHRSRATAKARYENEARRSQRVPPFYLAASPLRSKYLCVCLRSKATLSLRIVYCVSLRSKAASPLRPPKAALPLNPYAEAALPLGTAEAQCDLHPHPQERHCH